MIDKDNNAVLSKPRLILVTQIFDPEPTFKGLVFARALQERGFDVEVVTGFPNYPGGKVYPGFKIRPVQREKIDEITITRLALYPSHNSNPIARAANYLSFALSVFIYMTFFIRKADIIYVYHPPLTASMAVVMAQFARKTPVVLDIQDMWPDTIAATGMIKSALPIRLLSVVCRWVYSRASHIVVLSPGFKRLLIERGVANKKITVIYNWADEIATSCSSSNRPSLMPDDGTFKLLFAGNMGLAQNLDTVLDAAKIVSKKAQDVEISLLGNGLELVRLKNRVVDENITNVRFLPRVPMSDVGKYLAAADCLLVNLSDDPLFEITIPSKTQAYLNAGRPIIMAVKGDAADLVEKSGAGLSVPPNDISSLADAILTMCALSTEERKNFSKAGKIYYDKNLSLKKGVDLFSDLFISIIND